MRYTDESCKVIVAAETSLRSLAEKALADRSYADVAHIASLADALRELSQRADGGVDLPQAARPNRSPASLGRVNRPATPRSKTRARASRGYPRFERDGEKLVKIGWSKKGREEYEHRAPRKAMEAFVEYLSSRAREGEAISVDDVLLVRNGAGDQLPSYQVYLALAWLRELGAIKKVGREGYFLQGDMITNGGLDELWARTEVRNP